MAKAYVNIIPKGLCALRSFIALDTFRMLKPLLKGSIFQHFKTQMDIVPLSCH